MRIVTIAVIYVFLVDTTQATESYKPEEKPLEKRYFGKRSFALAGTGTAIAHAKNSPMEWGRGASGLAKRFGSAFGKHMVKTSVQVGVAAWRHEDLKYYPSEKPGFRPRMQHALVSTVVARKKPSGNPTVATSRLSGAAASGFVSRLWMPVRLRTVGNGVASAGISLGVDAGTNAVREFWPEIRHPRRRR